MKLIVIGGGGREHAIIKKLKENPEVTKIYALPGNGGIAQDAECVNIGATDVEKIVEFSREIQADYAVVTPDDPLAAGCVDALEAAGVPCFGPRQNAAVIESSKVFAKNLMKKYGIPTAKYETFNDIDAALAYLDTAPVPTVIKADGLALGKGVIIAATREEAKAAAVSMMRDKKFGKSGEHIVIEEFLTGPEVSVLSFTDGKTIVPMISSMDHKRAGDNDTGLNTGGMGTIAPNPYYTPEIAERVMNEIMLPTVAAMNAEGRTFKGCLYFGLMLTPQGPKVIEYNCRFGDPETQVVLPLLKSDLLTVMRAVTEGRLAEVPVEFSNKSACCVICASGGYPEHYEKGYPVKISREIPGNIYYAGVKAGNNGELLTSGGRVLGVTEVADTLSGAIAAAYASVQAVEFEKMHYRKDIGRRALAMVHRIYVEKKPELAQEAAGLCSELQEFLGLKGIEKLRIVNRYDAADIDPQLFDYAVKTVFSEPQQDDVTENPDFSGAGAVFAVEYLPGQFDQRADSAAQCIQIISQGERPLVKYAKVYVLYGKFTAEELEKVKKYVINPVEAREAKLEKPETLAESYAIPETVPVLEGFRELEGDAIDAFVKKYGLAMDADDVRFCRDYFREEGRDPTLTEVRVIDTYWSDHCRHTTFLTVIDDVKFEDPLLEETYRKYLETRKALGRTKPICLMDIGTLAAKYLRKQGLLDKLDESEEVNACTVRVDVDVDGKTEPWLLLFKNETHNHPTEIEPFGGAATCIGGAIRDPLSGRSYVYGAMRLTGAADPLASAADTIPGKLPQRKIVTGAAAGYSSYGNQIGLATGIVDEIYHPGYAAKRMEIGAVIAAAPAANVRRERPEPGDVVILLGGRTGRDGIGGATGSSKAHDSHSVETCGAEVQKGNAPEERKLQRLFRDPEASRLIKRCNDFGAGGVSVAIGELAPGLDIDLNAVPKKYEGLDGTELAISESQERMAVCVEAKDCARFMELAARENLQASVVAEVKAERRLTMTWNGAKIVNISRDFLDTNGAEKHISVETGRKTYKNAPIEGDIRSNFLKVASDLNVCSRRGLAERFDSTIGAGTVLMPFGGKYQRTPIQAMAQKISVEKGHTDTCSLMSWGFEPAVSEQSPYRGAYVAVVESVCKLIAAGAEFKDVYLTFQEYFPRLGKDSKRWGSPFEALLGAFRAQLELGIGAIGGKDSMSGSFEALDVPPTLVSFAVTTTSAKRVISPEFKQAGNKVVRLTAKAGADGLPEAGNLKKLFGEISENISRGRIISCYVPGPGGVAAAVIKMCLGNALSFAFAPEISKEDLFTYVPGEFVCELAPGIDALDCEAECTLLGTITADGQLVAGGNGIDPRQNIPMSVISGVYEDKLEPVYSLKASKTAADKTAETFSYTEGAKADGTRSYPKPTIKHAKPVVLIPAFPGTNCEYDSAKAMADAGAEPKIMVIRNLTAAGIRESAEAFSKAANDAQIIFIPGGFSGGDEPEGSGKFITAFFRSSQVKDSVTRLLEQRDGLMCGICNGFQALIKLGLVPYGRIIDTDADCPTLTFNTIARHQSKIVETRIASNKSPWLSRTKVGDRFMVPISHGEGRFIAPEELIRKLAANGQIATQYIGPDGLATYDIQYNPNGSMFAVEGITSPDGRVFGKMGHCERRGADLYKNVPGNYDIGMFEAAVEYYKI